MSAGKILWRFFPREWRDPTTALHCFFNIGLFRALFDSFLCAVAAVSAHLERRRVHQGQRRARQEPQNDRHAARARVVVRFKQTKQDARVDIQEFF